MKNIDYYIQFINIFKKKNYRDERKYHNKRRIKKKERRKINYE
jgi:hypothetical protein